MRTDLHLKVDGGPGAGVERTLAPDGAYTIGRSETADLCIDDPKISRLHCRVQGTGDGWVLEDLKSRNGTWARGRRVRSLVLSDGEHFILGKATAVTVRIVAARPAREAVVAGPRPGPRDPEPAPGGGADVPVLSGPLAALPGTSLGEFRIIEPIAPLGSGTFFRAMQPSLNRHVMIEVFGRSEMEAPGVRDALLREVQAAAPLLHPGVLQIFDLGESRGFTYVSMELFRGSPLARVMEERGFVPIGSAIAVARQLAEALSCGVDHGRPVGSLSPSDIWIDGDFTVKVKIFREPGTPEPPVSHFAYQAPEVLAGGDAAEPRAAVYCVGALLYHMLAATSPIPGATRAEIARRARHDTPPPLRRVNIKVTAMLAKVVEQAIAKDPAVRQRGPRELSRDLRRATGTAG